MERKIAEFTEQANHMSQSNIGCFGMLLRLLGLAPQRRGHEDVRGRPSDAPAASLPPVMVNKFFVSPTEGHFFRLLRNSVGPRGHVLAQVSLGRLLYLPGGNANNPGRASWSNKVARKSVDFVVCDATTLRPLCAVELDDATHGRAARQQRDAEVEQLLAAAGLPLERFRVSRQYDERDIRARISRHMTSASVPGVTYPPVPPPLP